MHALQVTLTVGEKKVTVQVDVQQTSTTKSITLSFITCGLMGSAGTSAMNQFSEDFLLQGQ